MFEIIITHFAFSFIGHLTIGNNAFGGSVKGVAIGTLATMEREEVR
jgi:hypothetical protein